MEEYIKKYDSFEESLVYDFNIDYGGIGDCIKFFIIILESCIKNNKRLYYKKNNIEIENFIKLKHDKMYFQQNQIEVSNNTNIVTPGMFYSNITYDYNINISDVFYFTDDVITNSKTIFPLINDYISLHLRMGDKFLETDKNFVFCKDDERHFSEEKLYNFIENNFDKKIFFCCDNKKYKLNLKEKYSNIIITDCDIGHTGLRNTTKKQVLDGITEFFILTKSEIIIAVTESGFSIIASKFNNIPLQYL
jgi:hypothetical protein